MDSSPRFAYVTTDSVDAHALARFWSGLLDLPVTYDEPPYVVIGRARDGATLAFQQVAEAAPPGRVHLDLHVPDIAAAAGGASSAARSGRTSPRTA